MSSPADLRTALADAVAALAGPQAAPLQPTLERPRRADFGDYSTNAALLLAPILGEPPRTVAERLGGELERRLAGALARAEVAGPGFINLFLADAWFAAALARPLAAGEDYGGGDAAAPRRIDVEFVSANPTGPLHVAHGRHAAYGDALARVLSFHGHSVEREFYVNDYGSQIVRLAESMRARARGEPVPADGYQGDYIGELVEPQLAATLELDELGRLAVAALLQRIAATLERFGVHFDVWFSERSLHEGDPSPVALALAALEQAGAAYRSEGALWLRSSAHGDDEDRVLVRSSGEHTYLASDVAYHLDKLARGFELLIDVWGADHHGYRVRLHAALAALGHDPALLELIVLQFVHLIEGGGRTSMSKRRGEYVTLDELIDEIGVDAARYFLVARSPDTTMDLDLALARTQSNDNPVYYIQYAHARLHSVLERAGTERVQAAGAELPSTPLEAAERALIHRLIAFPDEVAEASERRAPHRIAAYAVELAQDFTAFYRDCRIVGAEPADLERFRIALALATRSTIARALALLGVNAPTTM